MKKVLIEINKIKIYKIIFLLLILFFSSTKISASENKILVKIENEIITTIDIENESRFLKSLNPQVKDLDDSEIFTISKNAIIRQKIKKIEILKNNIELNISDKFLNKLIKSNYSRIGINNLDDFNRYMKRFDLNTKNIREKMTTEAIWNELIFNKYSSKIKINKEELKNEILKNKSKSISYHLYEILFNVSESSKFNEKYNDIKESIDQSNFSNAALIHSISNTSDIGGNLGWINENSLNKKIKEKITRLKKNQYSDPILSSGGFLILMVKDKKEVENKINLEEELQKMINLKTNQQFQQFSNMYFNKIKKNITINEL